MARNISLIVYPVTDVARAKTFFAAFLGVEPYADTPYYVGYKTGEYEVGLDPNSTTGPIGYVDVQDIHTSLHEMTAAGGTVMQDVQDVGSGLLIAQVKDTDGNVVGLRQKP